MVTLAMVLTVVGIPEVGIALILGMDRLLDMFRTAVNVTGDLSTTVTMAFSKVSLLRRLAPTKTSRIPTKALRVELIMPQSGRD